MPKRRASDHDLIAELGGVLLMLGKKKDAVNADDIAAIATVLRSSQDALLMPSSDPRIHAIETWLLVLIESAHSEERVGITGVSTYRTTFIDRQAFDLALNRLQSLHFQGVAMRRTNHARFVDEE